MRSVNRSILVVDDEEDIASLLRDYITKIGISVESFTDPVSAYNSFRENPYSFHLVLTDFRMPRLNGIDLANKIREINTTTKIILITAFEVSEIVNRSKFESSRISHVLRKPIKLSLLKSILEENASILKWY